MTKAITSAMILCTVLFGCQSEPSEKFVPSGERRREKLATPEPGTYLKPMAHRVLREVNRIMEDPESFDEPPEWIRNVLAAKQKKLLDTVISHRGHSVPVRIYYPTRRSLNGMNPVTLFIHGGGFILGSVDEYHIMVSRLARITRQIVVSVEYRLAPEFPFPAGLNDCFAALRWLQEQGGEIGADTAMISLMGDSAGGNLATVLTLRCRDEGHPQPRSQVLLYPGVTFLETDFPSRRYFARSGEMNFMLTESFLRRVREAYVGDTVPLSHPYLSPLEADLSADLAPALVITAECDPIRDGGRLYARRLDQAGVGVEHLEYSGMIHGFISFHMVLREANHAMRHIREYLEGI